MNTPLPPATTAAPQRPSAQALRRANLRTAIVLGSIAATFFVGIIVAKSLGGFDEGISLMGMLVCLFLAVAIGRNLRSDR
jgi:predicted lipid-binding transport protein (Tim44 family)